MRLVLDLGLASAGQASFHTSHTKDNEARSLSKQLRILQRQFSHVGITVLMQCLLSSLAYTIFIKDAWRLVLIALARLFGRKITIITVWKLFQFIESFKEQVSLFLLFFYEMIDLTNV